MNDGYGERETLCISHYSLVIRQSHEGASARKTLDVL